MKPQDFPDKITGERGIDLIRAFEGCRFRAYRDGGGVWTIGYGHTRGVREGQECDMAQAVQWLKSDVLDAAGAVNRLVKAPITQAQFDALVCFTYNLGAGSLEKSTLLKFLNAGDYYGAASQFGRWNMDNGQVVPGLTRRRKAEADLFQDGIVASTHGQVGA